MKITFIVNQFPPQITSGLGRYVEEISPILASKHSLTVFTLNSGHQATHERVGGVTVFRPPLGRVIGAISRRRRLNRTRRTEFLLLAAIVIGNNWRYYRRLRQAGPDDRPDLVAVHDSTNFLSGLLCHYLLRLPIVFHVHTTEYGVAPRRSIVDPFHLFAAIERWLARIARRVVVASPEVREQLAAAGWDREKIDVVLLGGTFERVLADPGFDRAQLRSGAARLRRRLDIPADALVLLFVGRLERQKGIYQLLAAMPRIAAEVPEVRLVVVGEGDETGVARIVADCGLDKHVLTASGFLTGQALLEFFEMADACVFPSLFEPFGLVAAEAMSLGKPVVLGDGFSRIFLGEADQPAARYARSLDSDDIAATVVSVLTDPELRRTLGANGERLVRERLSWAQAVDETLAAYRKALGPATT